jgi:hypothetical protein
MFSLLPVTKVISLIAGSYAILAILVTLGMERLGMPVSPFRVFSGAAIVDLGLLFFVYVGWRWLWVKVPNLNRWFYPDLNGMWDASIDWVKDDQTGRASGRVSIKQNFFTISIEMDADRSESRTLALSVKKDPESSRPLLHYIYEVKEKYTSHGQNKVYQGAASLLVDVVSNDRLGGNYFTSRGTGGRFEFRRRAVDASLIAVR